MQYGLVFDLYILYISKVGEIFLFPGVWILPATLPTSGGGGRGEGNGKSTLYDFVLIGLWSRDILFNCRRPVTDEI